MSANSNHSSPIVQFFDNFLQEKNIKWLLAIGVAILMGSSVMLVNSHWHSLGEAWKYLILVGYVGAIHAAAQWTYHSMGLRKTGTVLMGLTVLLIPVSFICWHLFVMGNWLEPTANSVSRPMAMVLLLANLVFGGLASDRIFRHFLQGRQTTFSFCYMLLCLAGALTPTIAATNSVLLNIAVSLVLWGAYLVGSIKVNRHVFWLVETHRSPTIYGFFPVLLLGTQFLCLFAVNFAGSIPVQWLGFALVQFALPIFLTADTVARIFKQRTGELVKRLPLAVALPLASGILLCVAGLVLAASPLVSGGMPYALVPTAILAAIIMGGAAWSTQHRGFTWLMLIATTLAYNFSPVFFREFASQVAQSGAELVNAARLPYAFYGLTYLPLIIALTVAAITTARRKWSVFALPIQRFSILLPILLLLASFSQPSLGLYPAFLVSTAMVAVFTTQTVVYRNRLLSLLALSSLLFSSISLPAFLSQVFNIHLTAFVGLMIAQAVGLVLTFVGPRWDKRLRQLVEVEPAKLRIFTLNTVCQSTGFLTMAGAAIAWLVMAFTMDAPPVQVYGSAMVIAAVLLRHALVHELNWLTGLTYGFVLSVLGMSIFRNDVTPQQSMNLAACLFLAQWNLVYLFDRFPKARLSRVFGKTNFVSAVIGLSVLAVMFALEQFTRMAMSSVPTTTDMVTNVLCALLVAWCCDMAYRMCQPVATYVACVLGGLLATQTAINVFGLAELWLPVLWASLAVLLLPVVAIFEQRRKRLDSEIVMAEVYAGNEALRVPLRHCIFGAFVLLSIITIVVPMWSARLAGGISIVGLVLAYGLLDQKWARVAGAAFATWHLITGALQLVGLDRTLDFLEAEPGYACSIFAALSMPILLVWDRYQYGNDKPSDNIAMSQSVLLRFVSWLAIAGCFASAIILRNRILPAEGALTLFAIITFGWSQVMAALRTDKPLYGWSFLAAVAAGVGYTLIAFAVPMSGLALAIALLAASFVAEGLHWKVQHRAAFREPASLTSLGGSIAGAAIAAIQQVTPLSSLVMLFAAGSFFWRGMNTRETDGGHVKQFGIAGMITIVTLWRTLFNFDFSDPQLYLIPTGAIVLLFVEVLRRDLPKSLANSLRYVGALCILVSPTFEIVDGSWLHMFVLMVASVLLILLSIGVQARALLYVGTGFLVADLAAMTVRGCWDSPSMLWLGGIGVGIAVLTVAAIAENGRERLLQRMRVLSSTLQAWD